MTLGQTIYRLAVYQLFPIALAIFAFGAVYRIARYLLYWRRPVKAEARPRSAGQLIIAFIRTFIDPIIYALKEKPHDFVFGLLFLHLLGVIPLIFLLAQHVVIWAYYLPPYWLVAELGLWLPESITSATLQTSAPLIPATEMRYVFHSSVWGPLATILNGDVLAVLALIGVGGKIGIKIYEKARGARNVRIGDIVNYALLLGILVTGFMAARHSLMEQGLATDVDTYYLLLGLHVLFAELLLAWLPFSKYWHFVWGYWYGKLHEFWDLRYQRGAV